MSTHSHSQAAESPPGAAIIDWHAGSPIYERAPATDAAVASAAPRGCAWLIKPGDLVCDWLKVKDADSRGLLRLFVNLTLYAKISVAIAFLVS
ncbi:MAG: hypothetical protein HKN60_07765 [Rhizobiales bacterium]|nr:hypothetical protein [Hyphomicrobiales bacterium]